MIDLDKYDSEESQSSYRAKNSKELKHLKGEVKRLRAENASLKSAREVAAEKHKTQKESDDNDISWFYWLLFITLFMFLVNHALSKGYDQVIEYKNKYEQCLNSNDPVELRNLNGILEVKSAFIKAQYAALQLAADKERYEKSIYGFSSALERAGLSNATFERLEISPSLLVNDGNMIQQISKTFKEQYASELERESIAATTKLINTERSSKTKIIDQIKSEGDRYIEDFQDGAINAINYVRNILTDPNLEVLEGGEKELERIRGSRQ
ncbi:TPA: hypothetical protein ACGR77_002676 [Pseudomonas aeruginosa]|uniref:hypothetical protein n=1 Tax=Pseudomonas sp. FSL R10-2398 TaxID=2662201 RepID=UPI0012953729|nr:hypothetical protein [Pseudomonas sp. FSL R10-2398]MQT50882.1 hypothetical protein [Pseudomonas sp. FSL R10-2398]